MNTAHAMRGNQRGFTLIEMIVVMAVFITVLIITASAFDTILKQSSKLFRSEESNIEGMIGLEMLRHDLQQAGYGLFTEQPDPSTYTDEAAGTPSSIYNDAPDNVPRPVVAGNNLASGTTVGTSTLIADSDYLAIKGTTVGRSSTAQKWTFLRISSNVVLPQQWASDSENLTAAPQERVVVIQKQFGTPMRSTLVKDPANNFYFDYSSTAFNGLAANAAAIYTAYGVDDAVLRFPFNRSDYFVAVPAAATSLPPVCAPGSGILYKTTVNHGDGTLSYVPVLDCVLDLQVVLGWDMNNDAVIDTYSNADGSAVSSGIAEGTIANVQAALTTTNNNTIATTPSIRNSLKMIKLYVIAQNGRRDPGYTSSTPLTVGDVGETSLTRPAGLPLATNQQNYRWKQYRIVVRPKNLQANQ